MENVVITGAASGIGEALCLVFAEQGYRVIAIDRTPASSKPSYNFLNFDISCLSRDHAETDSFFRELESLTRGRLDVLVNNAAVQVVKRIGEITADDWKITLDTNLLAPFWLIQRLLPSLKQAKGRVINISSIHSRLTKARFSVYAASKGALESLTRALALELAPDIRINTLVPAATDTPMLKKGFGPDLKGLNQLGQYHPLARIARPEEVAQAALFLASEKSSFITGSSLVIDGGIGSVLHDPATQD